MVAVALGDKVRSAAESVKPVIFSEAVIVTGMVGVLLLACSGCEVISRVGLPVAVVSTLMALVISELALVTSGSGRTSPANPLITTFPKVRALVEV